MTSWRSRGRVLGPEFMYSPARLVIGVLVAWLLLAASISPAGAAASGSPALLVDSSDYDRNVYSYDLPANQSRASFAQMSLGAVRAYDPHANPGNVPSARISSIPAAGGVDDLVPTVGALTRGQDAALGAVMRNPNDLRHIFGQQGKHGLAPLTRELGSQEAVVREAILRVPRTQPEGIFKISTQIGPYPTTVTGNMINGVPRISNIWVPPR